MISNLADESLPGSCQMSELGVRHHYASSSSRALACLKSSVSKPSVNHP
jgi:hypothetical protein